jgi:hypothetical protein
MIEASRRNGPGSITDKPHVGPPTAKDGMLASDVIVARQTLMAASEMLAAMDRVVALRPTTGAASRWTPGAGLHYWLAVGQLSAATDGLFTQADLDNYARDWTTFRSLAADGIALCGVGFTAGRTGRARGRTADQMELAVRSVAFRIAGASPSAADGMAADAYNADRPPGYWKSPSSVGVYRKRLRDRLG